MVSVCVPSSQWAARLQRIASVSSTDKAFPVMELLCAFF